MGSGGLEERHMDDIDWSKWDDAVELTSEKRQIPPGCVTTKQLAERWGIAPRSVRDRLAKLIDAGLAERFGSHHSTCYRLTK